MFNNACMHGDIVIDMRLMRSINIDVEERTAWVDSGCIVFDVDQEAIAHNLAAVTGQYYDTGIAGFSLGGGLGFLSPRYGLSVDNLLAVEVVTPQGELLYIDDETDPEKMWVARGAGWNLGVVLRLKLKMYPLETFQHQGKTVHGYGGFLMWPLTAESVDPIAKIIQKLFSLVESGKVPVETQPLMAFANPPPGDAPVLLLQNIWVGNPAGGEAFAKLFSDILEPSVNTCAPLHWLAIQDVHTAMFERENRYYLSTRTANAEGLFGAAAVRTLTMEMLEKKPKEGFLVMIAGGKGITDVPMERTACTSLRESPVVCMVGCHVEDDDENIPAYEKAKAWVRNTLEGGAGPICKHSVYTNLDNVGTGDHGKQSAYAETARERISAVKKAMDPDNIFRFTKTR